MSHETPQKKIISACGNVLETASRSSVRVVSVILTAEPLLLPLALILIIKTLKHGTTSSFGKLPTYIPLLCNIFYKIKKKSYWAHEMCQWAKTLAAKPDDLRSSLESTGWETRFLQVAF